MQLTKIIHWLGYGVLLLLGGVMTYSATTGSLASLEARVFPNEVELEIPWRSFDEAEVMSGVTIPANSNVIIHLPIEQTRITREVLFGRQGKKIRYWGYCFPEGYDPHAAITDYGFPGKIFLSEAERAERERQRQRRFSPFSIFDPPTKEDIQLQSQSVETRIRHQIEIFKGGTSCYVMSEGPLATGLDPDKDGLNNALEHQYLTDIWSADTDQDGITDGKEVFSLRTIPTRRDTDGDGLIDGIEDKNRNGIINAGETSPLERDSDRDGLCDGYCRVSSSSRDCSQFSDITACRAASAQWRGEDKNLDGVLDDGEYDPTKIDTDKNGILDEQEYFNCLLEGSDNC